LVSESSSALRHPQGEIQADINVVGDQVQNGRLADERGGRLAIQPSQPVGIVKRGAVD